MELQVEMGPRLRGPLKAIETKWLALNLNWQLNHITEEVGPSLAIDPKHQILSKFDSEMSVDQRKQQQDQFNRMLKLNHNDKLPSGKHMVNVLVYFSVDDSKHVLDGVDNVYRILTRYSVEFGYPLLAVAHIHEVKRHFHIHVMYDLGKNKTDQQDHVNLQQWVAKQFG